MTTNAVVDRAKQRLMDARATPETVAAFVDVMNHTLEVMADGLELLAEDADDCEVAMAYLNAISEVTSIVIDSMLVGQFYPGEKGEA